MFHVRALFWGFYISGLYTVYLLLATRAFCEGYVMLEVVYPGSKDMCAVVY